MNMKFEISINIFWIFISSKSQVKYLIAQLDELTLFRSIWQTKEILYVGSLLLKRCRLHPNFIYYRRLRLI
jgi:hypothetical protein